MKAADLRADRARNEAKLMDYRRDGLPDTHILLRRLIRRIDVIDRLLAAIEPDRGD